MRLLRSTVWLFLLLIAIPAGADELAECQKDIDIYIDVSETIEQARWSNNAAVVLNLLKSRFRSSSDHITVSVFADRTVEIFPGLAGNETVETVLSRLAQSPSFLQTIRPPLNRQKTDFRNVLQMALRHTQSERHHFLVIASDFLHDPSPSQCALDLSRDHQIDEMSNVLKRIAVERSAAPRPILIPLSPQVTEECSDIANRVRGALGQYFDLRLNETFVNFAFDPNQVTRQLAKEPTLQDDDDSRDVDAEHIPLIVKNPNPFRVVLKHVLVDGVPVKGVRVDGKSRDTEQLNLEVDCGPRLIQVPFHVSNLGQTTVRLRGEFDEVPSPQRNYSLEHVLINDGAGAVFPRFFQEGTAILDLDIDQNLMTNRDLLITIGERSVQRIGLNHGKKNWRVILPIRLHYDDIAAFSGSRIPVKFTLVPRGAETPSPTDSARIVVQKEPVNRTNVATKIWYRILQFASFLSVVLTFLHLGQRAKLSLLAVFTFAACFVGIVEPPYLPKTYDVLGLGIASLGSSLILTAATWLILICAIWPWIWERKALLSPERAHHYRVISRVILFGVAIGSFILNAVVLPRIGA